MMAAEAAATEGRLLDGIESNPGYERVLFDAKQGFCVVSTWMVGVDAQVAAGSASVSSPLLDPLHSLLVSTSISSMAEVKWAAMNGSSGSVCVVGLYAAIIERKARQNRADYFDGSQAW